MGAIADAVLEAGGDVIGVITEALATKEVAHTELRDLRVVATMHERKSLMAELSDAFIALPGGLGTFEELFEVMTWSQLGVHRKGCGLLNVCGYFDPLLALLDRAVDERFLKPEHRGMLLVADDAEEMVARLAAHVPPALDKWLDRSST